MNFLLTKHFKKQLKHYLKKDRSLAGNFKKALEIFNAKFATTIGKSVYKIRIKAQNKGKSGGYRVYILLLEVKNYIVPLCIYAKSDKANLAPKELNEHLNKTMAELTELDES